MAFKKDKRAQAFSEGQLVELFKSMNELGIKTRGKDLRACVRTAVASILSLTTGLRLREVVSLKHTNLLWDRNKIDVINGKSGDDLVDFHPKVQKIIRKWSLTVKDSEWLFPSRQVEGAGIDEKTLQRDFIKFLKKAKLWLKKFNDVKGREFHVYSYHSLRHTFATIQLEANVPIYHVQKSMRHKNVRTTIDTYGHVRSNVVQEETFGAFWNTPKKKTVDNFVGFDDLKKEVEIIKMKQQIEDPFRMLDLRLAKGEISTEEYNRVLDTLRTRTNFSDNPVLQKKPDYLG